MPRSVRVTVGGQSPGTTPTPPAETFTYGVTKPTAANTGYAPGTTLTVVSGGTVTHSTDNAVYEGYDFRALVKCTASNVTYRNCLFSGNTAGWANQYGLLNTESATNATVERCTFNATLPQQWLQGIKGKSMTVDRCDFAACVDGIQVRGPDTVVKGCYFHDFYFSDQSTEQNGDYSNPPAWTHNDGIQWHVAIASAPNHLVWGNSFDWFAGIGAKFNRNAALDTGYLVAHPTLDPSYAKGHEYRRPVISDNTGRYQWGSALTLDCPSGGSAVTGLEIKENWLACGGVLFQASEIHPQHVWGSIHDNLCDQDLYTGKSYDHWYAIRYNNAHSPTSTANNYWMDVSTVDPVDRGTLLTLGVNQGLENTG